MEVREGDDGDGGDGGEARDVGEGGQAGQAAILPGGQEAIPTVNVFVAVLSFDMSVFHDTFPPVDASWKVSGVRAAMWEGCRISGLMAAALRGRDMIWLGFVLFG